jgi:hypothetical protein
MGVWQGMGMDSLKYHYGLLCPTPLRPVDGQSRNGLTAGSGETACRPGDLWLSSTPLDTPGRTRLSFRCLMVVLLQISGVLGFLFYEGSPHGSPQFARPPNLTFFEGKLHDQAENIDK